MFELHSSIFQFLPARRLLCAGISRLRVSVCVRVSHAGVVSKRLNVRSRKQRHVITQGVLLSDANSRCWATPTAPEICAQRDPPPSNTTISTNIRLPWCSASCGFVSDSWATCRTVHYHCVSVARYGQRTTPLRLRAICMQIFFSELKFTFIESQAAYTTQSLLSDIGGSLGLIVGATILTLCEIVDFLFQLSVLLVKARSSVIPLKRCVHKSTWPPDWKT